MSEYTATGLFVLISIIVILTIYFIDYSVRKRSYKRKLNKITKMYNRIKKNEEYAEFVAIASAYSNKKRG